MTDDEIRMDATYRMLGISNHLQMTQRIAEPDAHSVVTFESPGLSGEMDYRFRESDGVTTVIESADYEFGDSLRTASSNPSVNGTMSGSSATASRTCAS